MKINRLLGGQTLGEILSGRDLREGHQAGEVENLEKGPLREPVAVVMNLGLGEVDDLADLIEVVLGVFGHLGFGQARTGFVAARGVAHQGGVVSDDDDGGVAEILKLPELSERNGVAKVNADAGRVDAVLHP